jgi:hypothetical protein
MADYQQPGQHIHPQHQYSPLHPPRLDHLHLLQQPVHLQQQAALVAVQDLERQRLLKLSQDLAESPRL